MPDLDAMPSLFPLFQFINRFSKFGCIPRSSSSDRLRWWSRHFQPQPLARAAPKVSSIPIPPQPLPPPPTLPASPRTPRQRGPPFPPLPLSLCLPFPTPSSIYALTAGTTQPASSTTRSALPLPPASPPTTHQHRRATQHLRPSLYTRQPWNPHLEPINPISLTPPASTTACSRRQPAAIRSAHLPLASNLKIQSLKLLILFHYFLLFLVIFFYL